jgi:Fe-S cluster biogenesis protein NfuA
MRAKVDEVLDAVLRPLVEADGGRIELLSVQDDTIVIRLFGACAGCPGVHYTHRHVIEPALRAALAGRDVTVHVRATTVTPGSGATESASSSS